MDFVLITICRILKFKEQLPNKESFYSSLTGKKKKNSDKHYDHVL